jgi:hypothetical protein
MFVPPFRRRDPAPDAGWRQADAFPIFFVGIVDRRGENGLETDNPTEFFSQVFATQQQGTDP